MGERLYPGMSDTVAHDMQYYGGLGGVLWLGQEGSGRIPSPEVPWAPPRYVTGPDEAHFPLGRYLLERAPRGPSRPAENPYSLSGGRGGRGPKDPKMKLRGNREAFGAPGMPPRWTHSNKEAVGTAYSSDSKYLYTRRQGILTDVYYPTGGSPQIRAGTLARCRHHSFLGRGCWRRPG